MASTVGSSAKTAVADDKTIIATRSSANKRLPVFFIALPHFFCP
jgi:hypothetical protein